MPHGRTLLVSSCNHQHRLATAEYIYLPIVTQSQVCSLQLIQQSGLHSLITTINSLRCLRSGPPSVPLRQWQFRSPPPRIGTRLPIQPYINTLYRFHQSRSRSSESNESSLNQNFRTDLMQGNSPSPMVPRSITMRLKSSPLNSRYVTESCDQHYV